jgi:hypothetical protein
MDIQKLQNKVLNHHLVLKLQAQLRRIVLPGFDGMPIFDVLVFLLRVDKRRVVEKSRFFVLQFLYGIVSSGAFFIYHHSLSAIDNFVALVMK